MRFEIVQRLEVIDQPVGCGDCIVPHLVEGFEVDGKAEDGQIELTRSSI